MGDFILSEVSDVVRLILLELDIKSLRDIFLVAPYFSNFSYDDNFWHNKVMKEFGDEVTKYKPENETFREQYKCLCLSSTSDFDTEVENNRLDAIVMLYNRGSFSAEDVSVKVVVEEGHLHILKWLETKGFDPIGNLDYRRGLFLAAKRGHFEMIKYLRPIITRVSTSNEVEVYFASNDAIYLNFDRRVATGAVESGRTDIIEWLLECGSKADIDTDIANHAVLGGIPILEWLYDKFKALPGELGMHHAVYQGKLDTLKWIINHGIPLYTYLVGPSIQEGHLNILKYFIDHEAVPSTHYINKACEDGHLHILVHLETVGKRLGVNLLPDVFGANWAAGNGEIELLEWLACRDPPILPNSSGANMAAENGHLDILRWMELQGIGATIDALILDPDDYDINMGEKYYKDVQDWLRERKDKLHKSHYFKFEDTVVDEGDLSSST